MTTQKVKKVVMSEALWKYVSRASAIVSVITILAFVWRTGHWQAMIEQRLAHIEKEDEAHHSDPGLHMPYEDKVENFVLRREWQAAQVSRERQIQEIGDRTKRIEDKLDRFLESR